MIDKYVLVIPFAIVAVIMITTFLYNLYKKEFKNDVESEGTA